MNESTRLDTESLHGNEDKIEKKRTLWDMSRKEIIEFWQSQDYSQELIDYELWEATRDWGVDQAGFYEWQTELQEMLLEWRQETQMRLARVSIEKSFAEKHYQAAVNNLIVLKQAHGITSEADIQDEAVREVYDYMRDQIDDALLDLNQSRQEYTASTEELTELAVINGEFYGKVHDELWGTHIYDQMPANRPAIG